jgi:hypothetical protein
MACTTRHAVSNVEDTRWHTCHTCDFRPLPCTFAGGAASRSVAVTCSSADPAGFPAGRHSITLTAAAADPTLTGCAAPLPVQLNTTLSFFAAPRLQLRPMEVQQAACRSDRAVTMRFSYVVRQGGSMPILSSPRAVVSVPGARAGASRINCTPTLRGKTTVV